MQTEKKTDKNGDEEPSEQNEILDDLGYEHHGYALPKTIEELHDFHVKCIETIAGR